MRSVMLRVWKPIWVLILALSGAGLSIMPAWAEDKPPERMTATVIEFAVRGNLDEQAGAIIADLMMSAIANTGRFILKDRLPLSAAAKIAKAQELGSTGLLDPKTAAELGKRYGVDAVVTGGVYKLGDLITVTARLIDTKTASLLRSGQIQGKDIDIIQIKVNELAAMITAPPPLTPTYVLTVKTTPPSANVRLLRSTTPYQPGVRLPSGDYEIEVTQSGYASHKETAHIVDRDVTLEVTLEKAKYGFTVRPEPTDAQIRLLNSPIVYQAGIQLVPGEYQVEVTREGYVRREFPVRIVDSEVIVPITLVRQEPQRPAQYRLTVQPDPSQAKIRLLNEKTSYQPGMELRPGQYTVEISASGYETRQVPVQIIDNDVTVPVALVKLPEPKEYQLTVRADPADARIRLLGIRPVYRPGIQLAPGSYTVEVSQSGYETQQTTVRITDSDVTVPVALVKLPESKEYQLTVRADPADARIRLRGIRSIYRPGVQLAPGSYTVEVSQSGYETQQLTVRITDSDMTVPVTLVKLPELKEYQLTVRADPADARIRLLGIRPVYRPGIQLAPGSYTVEVSRSGYTTQRVMARIVDADVSLPVVLERVVSITPPPTPSIPPSTPPPTVSTPSSSPSSASTSLSRTGPWQIRSVQVDGWMSGADRSEVMRVLNSYIGQSVTQQTLLGGAMRVYRTTGLTLSFVVRNSGSGSASLSARVAGRIRRTYESSVPIITPNQLENSGFGVSVE